MKKALCITGLSLLLAGCSPQSAAELRTRHHQHTSFEVAAPYATVYQRINEKARSEFSGGFMGSRYRVAHAIFRERKTANVSMFVETDVRNVVLVTIDISRVSADRTRVDVYGTQDAFAEKFAGEVPDWAAHD